MKIIQKHRIMWGNAATFSGSGAGYRAPSNGVLRPARAHPRFSTNSKDANRAFGQSRAFWDRCESRSIEVDEDPSIRLYDAPPIGTDQAPDQRSGAHPPKTFLQQGLVGEETPGRRSLSKRSIAAFPAGQVPGQQQMPSLSAKIFQLEPRPVQY
jgi:hypothetical protein